MKQFKQQNQPQPQASAALATNQQLANASAPAYPQPVAPLPPLAVVKPERQAIPMPAGAIELVKPSIRLGDYLMMPDGQTTRKLDPEKAFIYQGAIVIEELSLILPLAGNYVRTR